MRAGKTDLEVGTKVRITHIGDAEDRHLEGIDGAITHAFPGLMIGSSSSYVAGLIVSDESAAKFGLSGGPLGMPKINICVDDVIEVIEPSDDLDAEAVSFRP